MPPACFLNVLSNPITPIENPVTADAVTGFLVGVSGFEPEASWTRTKRDTKLRHTPLANPLYLLFQWLSSEKSAVLDRQKQSYDSDKKEGRVCL